MTCPASPLVTCNELVLAPAQSEVNTTIKNKIRQTINTFQGQFPNVIPGRLAKLTAVILSCNLQTILLQLEQTTCQKTGNV